MGTENTPKRARGRPAKAPAAPLQAYHAKRNLSQSGEPQGGQPSTGLAKFVIQKHNATRLHYDLRLEVEGVFKSWAVPKGLPLKPGRRALAIEVEDHPLDYGSFEGVIPEGNYGAGTVMLWDRGIYATAEISAADALEKGKLHFALIGEKCRGEWTLVRLRTEGRKINWLVIKNPEGGRTTPIRRTGRELSVLTGRNMRQISQGEQSKK